MTGSNDWTIRPVTPHDVPAVLSLIHELALYEREPDAVQTDQADLHAALFGPAPQVYALVAAEQPSEMEGSGTSDVVVGMALWVVNFSTWRGRHGIWLEDLYVTPAKRGNGIGKALLSRLASICVDLRRTRISAAGMERSGLERTGPRLLRLPGSAAAGGMDSPSTDRCRPGPIRRRKTVNADSTSPKRVTKPHSARHDLSSKDRTPSSTQRGRLNHDDHRAA
jgi:GNAT superfamily N-acetyltransferase